MAAAIALSQRSLGLSAPNPNVGCLIVKQGRVIGRGWTQDGGRPHAEAMALGQAGEEAAGATAYVTLEPCAHESARGPACSSELVLAGIARCVVALTDPDPRTNGAGIARMRGVGVDVTTGVLEAEARAAMAGWLSVQERGRPFVTLKLATSLDGCIATGSGESQWITGEAARAHGHLERARSCAILVGRRTYDDDRPRLDVRLPGLEPRSPERLLLSSSRGDAETRSTESSPPRLRVSARTKKEGWVILNAPEEITTLTAVHHLLVEGGAQTAASFLKAGLVDRILLYRAPILIGGGKPCIGDIGLTSLADAHSQWLRTDTRQLGSDTLEVYERR